MFTITNFEQHGITASFALVAMVALVSMCITLARTVLTLVSAVKTSFVSASPDKKWHKDSSEVEVENPRDAQTMDPNLSCDDDDEDVDICSWEKIGGRMASIISMASADEVQVNSSNSCAHKGQGLPKEETDINADSDEDEKIDIDSWQRIGSRVASILSTMGEYEAQVETTSTVAVSLLDCMAGHLVLRDLASVPEGDDENKEFADDAKRMYSSFA